MPEHSGITDPEIHEPKGASTASANQIMGADGLGGTSWAYFASDYAELYTRESDSATLGSIGTTKQTFPFTTASSESNGITPSAASNNLTIGKTGVYWVGFAVSFETVAAGDAGLYHLVVSVNGTEQPIELFRQMSGASDTGSAAMMGIVSCTANDTLTVEIESDEAGDTDDINIKAASFFAFMLEQTA